MNSRNRRALLISCTLLVTFFSQITADAIVPKPEVTFLGAQYFESNGQPMTRYNYIVTNYKVGNQRPPLLNMPLLSNCLPGKNASIIGVSFYTVQNNKPFKPLPTFCGRPINGLATFSFVLNANAIPPSWVYLVVKDPVTHTDVISDQLETTL